MDRKNRLIRNEKTSMILVIASCFMMTFVCMGFCSSNRSVYVVAITDALGISRSLFSFNDTCRYVATAVVNLYFGRLIAKFGVKKLVAAGFLCLTLATLFYAVGTHVVMFYLGGCFLGVGFSWTSTTVISYLVGLWCPERRGTITGFSLCANGLGGALAAQIITPIIYEAGNPFGYRNAYYLVIVLLVVSGILVTAFVREPDGHTRSGDVKKHKIRGNSWSGMTFAEAAKKPYFYVTCGCILLTGVSLQGIIGISAAHLGDVRIEPGMIATILSAHSVALCAAKFLAGVSYDKLGLRATIVICELFGVVSFVTLALSGNSSGGIACAYIWGITSSMAMPLETVLVPLIAADFFGEKEFPKIMGILVSVNTVGFAISTPVFNLVFDLWGSYLPMLYAVAGIMLLIIVGYHWAIRAANKERQRILSITE